MPILRSPKKCILIYGEEWLTNQKPSFASFDWLTDHGCSGLVYAEQHSTNHPLKELMMILGYDFEKFYPKKSDYIDQYRENFGDMRIKVLTESPEVKRMLNSLSDIDSNSSPCHQLMAADTVMKWLSLDIRKNIEDTDILILHGTLKSIRDIDQLLSRYLDEDYFFILLASPNNITQTKICSLPKKHNRTIKSPYFQDIEQSYQIKNGKHVQVMCSPLICTYYCRDLTRKDRCTFWESKHILENNGNLGILSYHFLKEVAYKLGFVKKYGA